MLAEKRGGRHFIGALCIWCTCASLLSRFSRVVLWDGETATAGCCVCPQDENSSASLSDVRSPHYIMPSILYRTRLSIPMRWTNLFALTECLAFSWNIAVYLYQRERERDSNRGLYESRGVINERE